MKVRSRNFPYGLKPGERHPDAGKKTSANGHIPRMRPNSKTAACELLRHAGYDAHVTEPLPEPPTPGRVRVTPAASAKLLAAGFAVGDSPAQGKGPLRIPGYLYAVVPHNLMPRSANEKFTSDQPITRPGRRLLRAVSGHGLHWDGTGLSV